MKLKSFGCSFVFGSDLGDIDWTARTLHPSNLTWPALIAQHTGNDYKCYAFPGCGNLQILEKVIEQALNPEPAIFVISWTWIDRFDFLDSESDVLWPGSNWKTIRPSDDSCLSQFYYKNLHTQYRDKLTNLIYIKSAVDILNQTGRRFIMTYVDDLIWETKWHSGTAITSMQKHIRNHFTDFEGKTFLEWSRSKNFKISDNLHPLEDAHRAAADFILADLARHVKYPAKPVAIQG